MASVHVSASAKFNCFGEEVVMNDRLKKFSEQVEELKRLKKNVQAKVPPKASPDPTEVARGWLERADVIIRRAESAIAKVEKKQDDTTCSQGCCCAHVLWRDKSGKRITKMTKEVIRHETKGKELEILHDDQAKPAAKEAKPAKAAAAGE